MATTAGKRPTTSAASRSTNSTSTSKEIASREKDRRAPPSFPLRPALFDRGKQVGNHFVARLRAEIALTMDTYADGVRFQVAIADDEHGVDFHLLGVGDFGLDVVAAGIELTADLVGAQFGLDGA